MHKSTTEVVYEFICAYKEQEGIAPSIREIATGCYLSTPTVRYQLMRLEAWGWVTVLPGKARGIVVLERKGKKVRQPAHEDPDPEGE